jgi:hypothetical protein
MCCLVQGVVIELAGATRGILALENAKQEWNIEIDATVDQTDGEDAHPLTSSDDSASEHSEHSSDAEPNSATGSRPSSRPMQIHKQRSQAPVRLQLGSVDSMSNSPDASSSSVIHPHSDSAPGSSPTHCGMSHEQKPGHARMPLSVLQYCVRTASALSLSPPASTSNVGSTQSATVLREHADWSVFSRDEYFAHHRPAALLCLPVLRRGVVFGVL